MLNAILQAVDTIQGTFTHDSSALDAAYENVLIHVKDMCTSNPTLLEKVRDGVMERMTEDEAVNRLMIALEKELSVHCKEIKARL